MPAEDLRAIPGLQENHRRELAAKLAITSLRALADADQRTVYEALRNIRAPSFADAHRGLAGRCSRQAPRHGGQRTGLAHLRLLCGDLRSAPGQRRLGAPDRSGANGGGTPRWNPGNGRAGTAGHCVTGCSANSTGQQARQIPKAGVADGAAATTAESAARTAPAQAAPARAAHARAARAELRIDSATITDAVQKLELIGRPCSRGDRRKPSGPRSA